MSGSVPPAATTTTTSPDPSSSNSSADSAFESSLSNYEASEQVAMSENMELQSLAARYSGAESAAKKDATS